MDSQDRENQKKINENIPEHVFGLDDDDMYEDIDEPLEADQQLRSYIIDRMNTLGLIYTNAFGFVVDMMVDEIPDEPERESGLPVIESRTDNMHDTGITQKMVAICKALEHREMAAEEDLFRQVYNSPKSQHAFACGPRPCLRAGTGHPLRGVRDE